MKILLTILCALMVLFAGGCALLALTGDGITGAVTSVPFATIPGAVAVLNGLVLAALWGGGTPRRGIFIALAILDALVVLGLAITWLSLGFGDSEVNALGILLVGGFALKGVLTALYLRRI